MIVRHVDFIVGLDALALGGLEVSEFLLPLVLFLFLDCISGDWMDNL